MNAARRAVLAVLLILAGLAAASPAARAAPVSHRAVYFYTYTAGESYRPATGAEVLVQEYSTSTYTNVWNNTITCPAIEAAYVTWCGVGSGNGTAVLSIGVNYADAAGGSYYFRIFLHAAATPYCTTTGNAPVRKWTSCFS